jgi:hypothetical protein
MLTKIRQIITAIAGVFITLASLFIIALFGVMVMFVGYFLIWGLIGIAIISFIVFLVWAWITDP